MSLFPLVAAAAGLGAAARYLVCTVSTVYLHNDAPWGTAVVNVSGSFALGVVVGLIMVTNASDAWQVVVGTGFLGAYTTFSTWMVELVALTEDDQLLKAAIYALGSILLGVAAAAGGLGLVVVSLGG